MRGVEFFKRLVCEFNFHNFDSIQQTGTRNRCDPRLSQLSSDRTLRINALYAAAEGDLTELKRFLVAGVSPNTCDYDGRSLLHLAASGGHLAICKTLLRIGTDGDEAVNVSVVDRWGGTAYSDAIKFGHCEVAKAIEGHI